MAKSAVRSADTPRGGSGSPTWLRSWAADSSALLFSQLAAVIATSALAILLARHLGPRDWGLFSAFLGLSLGLSIFIEFGLTQWLLRELARPWARHHATEKVPLPGRRRAGRIVGASLTVNAVFGATIIVGAGVAAAAFRVGPSSAVLLLALVTYGALLASCSVLEAVFRARRRLSRVVGATLLEKLLLLVLVAASILAGSDVFAVGLAYLVAGIARLGFDLVSIVRSQDVVFARPSRRTVRHVTRRSMPFALNRASLNIIPRLDTFVLAALSPVAAGYFALGDRALGPVVIIPVVMSTALYPFLAREPSGSRAGWKIVALLAAAGSVIAAIGVAVTPRLVPIVFGSDYLPAVPTVQVMLLAIPFVFAANPLLAHVYSARLEHRRLGIGLGCVSFLGTAAVVAGQMAVGPVGAACGYAARSAGVLGLLALAGSTRGSADRVLRGPPRTRDQRVSKPPVEPSSAPNSGRLT
jgi:O-antigen/teichoic acid export membrane protein